MNRIFSSMDLALNKIESYMLEKEEDIFLYETTYPSGKEYSFRIEKDVAFIDSPAIKKICAVPMWHMFRKKGRARRYKKKFENKYGREIKIDRVKADKNYVYTLSYV